MNALTFCAPSRAHRGRRRPSTQCRPEVVGLEARTLLTAPFAVGGDASVNPADFRVTTFASGLNYPKSMQQLSDGSLLVATSRPVRSPGAFWESTGELVRLVDADKNGEADGPATVLASGMPGMLTSVRTGGNLVFALSSMFGDQRITFLRAGATPGSPLTNVGSIRFAFPSNWSHTSYALAVRPTPGTPGSYDLFFNVGAQFNIEPTTGTVPMSGLISGTLQGDSIYKVTVNPAPATPTVSGLTRIATGLRNAAGMVFDTSTGDLYFEDNGIDGLVDGNEPTSADELNRIARADIGGAVEDFGYYRNYIKYRTGEEIGSGAVDPLFAFQPLPNPINGSESEGPAEIALAPPGFPSGLNRGTFVSFSGRGGTGGLANEENPLVFANATTGNYFHFVSNDEPNIGHITGLLSTDDSLFAADLDSTGKLFGTAGAGVIYQIRSNRASASFLGSDETSSGNWKGKYGADGYVLPGTGRSVPSYATITTSSPPVWNWAYTTNDPRALQLPTTGRRASTWYGASFSADVTINDGRSHRLSLYAVDWDAKGARSQRVELLDLATGTVLDSRMLDDFQNGIYLSWTITGSVRVRLTNLGAPNAVISGLFLGDAPGASASYLGTDATTQGSWRGTYGADGYLMPGIATSLPSYATLTVPAPAPPGWTWAPSTTDPRALQFPTTSARRASAWYASQFSVDVTINDGLAHRLSLYAIDWDAKGARSQRIELLDLATGALLDSRTLDDFQNGVYLSWTVTGRVRIRLTNLGTPNAVLSGLFFG